MNQEDPAALLRSLTAEALRHARVGQSLLPVSLSLQAVANAFVMLGLLPEPEAEQVLAGHRAALERKGFPRAWGVATGELTVRPGAHGYWDPRDGSDRPTRMAPPSPVEAKVGSAAPPWPTAAECYLAALAPVSSYSINEAQLDREDTGYIVAAVADALLAVGALPATSTLLRPPPDSSTPAWLDALAHRWGRRAHQRLRADPGHGQEFGLAVQLPLEHATAVIEAVAAADDLVSIQLYGHRPGSTTTIASHRIPEAKTANPRGQQVAHSVPRTYRGRCARFATRSFLRRSRS